MRFLSLERLYIFQFAALVFLLPFESIASVLPNIVLGLIIITFPFIIKRKDFNILKEPVYITLLLFISYLTVRLLFNDPEYELKFIKKLIPVYLIFVFVIPLKRIVILKYSFIISVFISILFSSIKLFLASYGNDQFQFAYGNIVNDTLIGERIYIGFMACISVIFSYGILKKEKKKALKFLLCINILAIFIFIIAIVARMALLNLLIILFFIGLVEFKKIRQRILYLSLLLLIFSVFGMLNIDNISKRLNYKGDFAKSIEWAKHREPRVLIWKCSYEFIKLERFNFLYGNGHRITQEFLNGCYLESIDPKFQLKRKVFKRNEYNTHNQYIDFFLSTGVVGVGLFLLFLLMVCHYKSWGVQVIMVVTSIMLFAMIENIFHRQIGFYLFALVIVMLESQWSHKRKLPKENLHTNDL